MKQSAFLFSLCAAVVSTLAPAGADEIQPFNGLYFGLHGGYSWENASGIYDNAGTPTNLAGIDPNGPIVGAQLGYNVQFGGFLDGVLIGLEADASALAGSGGQVVNNTTLLTGDLGYLASIRSRLGFVVQDVLLYGTLGFGFTEFKLNANDPSVPFNQTLRLKDTGGVYGGGAEWKVFEGVSVRGEYLHYDVKASSLIPGNFPNTDAGDVVNFHGIDVVRAGVSVSLGQ